MKQSTGPYDLHSARCQTRLGSLPFKYSFNTSANETYDWHRGDLWAALLMLSHLLQEFKFERKPCHGTERLMRLSDIPWAEFLTHHPYQPPINSYIPVSWHTHGTCSIYRSHIKHCYFPWHSMATLPEAKTHPEWPALDPFPTDRRELFLRS